MCGHDGIVHGGMVATVLDEATGRNVSSLERPSSLVLLDLPCVCVWGGGGGRGDQPEWGFHNVKHQELGPIPASVIL